VEAGVPGASAAIRVGGNTDSAKARRMQMNISATVGVAGNHDRPLRTAHLGEEVHPEDNLAGSRNMIRAVSVNVCRNRRSPSAYADPKPASAGNSNVT